MPTQEDRMADLERKVAALELRRMYDERKAQESTPSVQAFNLREINENMTILLGIASGQEEDTKILKEDVSDIKREIASLEEKLGPRFVSLEEKFEQMLQMLATLTTRTDK